MAPTKSVDKLSTLFMYTPSIESGSCSIIFVFDVGQLIDLNKAASHLDDGTSRAQIHVPKNVESFFGYSPAPLISTYSRSHETSPAPLLSPSSRYQITTWDIGVMSVEFTFAFSPDLPLSGLTELSAGIVDSPTLAAEAREYVSQLSGRISPAVTRPLIEEAYEDYVVFHIEKMTPALSLDTFSSLHGETIAQALRSERGRLSTEVVNNCLAYRASFSPDDVAIIDWNAALLIGPHDPDLIKVLEFAQVQLLEMRVLDMQLDRSLENAYRGFARLQDSTPVTLSSLALLSVDAAASFEAVNGALKLVGDQFLARIYRVCSERFEFPALTHSISGKLDALDNLYEKISDQKHAARAEMLEIVIIALILIEIIRDIVLR